MTNFTQGSFSGSPLSRTNALLSERVLVVNQKAKLFEGSSSYAIERPDGSAVGSVRQVGQSGFIRFLRAISNLGVFMKARFEILDEFGATQMVLVKPRSFVRPKFFIERADGSPVGRIEQKLRLGKARFLLIGGDGITEVGSINAENFRAWNFSITNASGVEVARVTKNWAGFTREFLTKADKYVVERVADVDEPLLSLCVASALTIDQVLKQIKS
jgi:uncharacterized protein YxjI